ncbi:MAG: CopD family protein [Gammaproteobacteria bacterium]|nr:CopD family protein [Gammaproteobacteria bacterium]
MAIALLLHLLFAVIWVGGMFFAWLCLRPAAGRLEPPLRARLWVETLSRFFPWVWAAVAVLLASGIYMVRVLGGMGAVNPYVHAMIGLGVLMMLLFAHVFFAPFRRLRRGIANRDVAAAGKALGQIRVLIAVNLLLGLLVLIAAAGGRAPY